MDLTTRVEALEAQIEVMRSAVGTVTAPFRVVDCAGRPLLTVEVDEEAVTGPDVRVLIHDRRTGTGIISLAVAESWVSDEEGSEGEVGQAYGRIKIGDGTRIGEGSIALECTREDELEPGWGVTIEAGSSGATVGLGTVDGHGSGTTRALTMGAGTGGCGVQIDGGEHPQVAGDPEATIALGVHHDTSEPFLEMRNRRGSQVIGIASDTGGNGQVTSADSDSYVTEELRSIGRPPVRILRVDP